MSNESSAAGTCRPAYWNPADSPRGVDDDDDAFLLHVKKGQIGSL